MEAIPDKDAAGGWRVKYGYQGSNSGKPGIAAATRVLSSPEEAAPPGLAFDIPVEQNARPGLLGTLRIEARPWA